MADETTTEVGADMQSIGLSMNEFVLNAKGEIKQTLTNCILALNMDTKLKGKFKYNMLTNQIDLIDKVWWNRHSISISDNDINNIRLYLEQMYGLNSEKGIPRAIDIIAHQNSYHPIQDMLNGLKWDGKSYIENLFTKYLGVEKTKYSVEAVKIFMLGAINRVFNHGCKFDTMLCVVGGQGIGKSTFFRLLALCDDWFSDELKKLEDDNVYRKIQGHWIIEFSEMLATGNAKSIEEIKSFISRQKETYKVPYETHPQDRPRQCIFCGTTNNVDFLPKDRTGNRRFVPLLAEESRAEIHPLEKEEETRTYIRMAWAEAMEIFRTGNYTLNFSQEMNAYLKEFQKEFVGEDVKIGIIQAWLDECQDEFVCSLMLYREALENEFGEAKSWELKEINDIMNSSITGWEKYKKSDGQKRFEKYGKQRAWKKKSEPVDAHFVDIEEIANQLEIPFQ